VRGFVKALVADPAGVIRALPGHLRMQQFTDVAYDVEESWQRRLHDLLRAPWPCPETAEFEVVMSAIVARLAARGLAFGRHTYGGYSDADLSLGRAVWCSVLHTRPEVAIETGVARGVSSRIVLEAMEKNDWGRLWSIDLPHPFNRGLHPETGAAVPEDGRRRWSYIRGTSRERLPQLVREVRHVELFIHDSLHTARNTRFEMDRVAAVMSPGGVMLIDDISTHVGFATFARDHPEYRTMVCRSDDQQGLFGIAVNAR
jgi:Methyltransferase domain